MAKYRVVRQFWDAENHRMYHPGEVIEMDEKRVKEYMLEEDKKGEPTIRGETPPPDPKYTSHTRKLERIDGRTKRAKVEPETEEE